MADIEKESDVQWVKPSSKLLASIIGKDIAVLTSGNFVTFLETSRPEKKEIIYQANNEVRGDGISCLCTHKTLPCFALAEACRNPRILIISYPNFEVCKSFDSVTDTNYIALKFSEMEYLIALTGIPDFKIVIWNWRTSEKLCCEETKLRSLSQHLCVSPTSPIQILQSNLKDRNIILWDMNICYKKTILNRIEDTLPSMSRPPYYFCYGGDGELYYVDSEGTLFSMNPENRLSMLHFASDGLQAHQYPCVAWYRGGVVFSTPSDVQYWRRKSPDGWTKIWVHYPKTPFIKLLSSFQKDHLVGITRWNEIMVLKGENQVDSFAARSYGSDFEFLCFIHPVGDYFLTFGNILKIFSVWNKANGHRVGNLSWLKKKVNAIESNPKWPYVAVVTEDGKTSIINAYNPGFVIEMVEIALTTRSLDGIRFDNKGSCFCVANYDVGQFFLLKLSAKLEVMAYVKINLKIVDFLIQEKEDSVGFELFVVPMSQICCRSGHVLIMYNLDEKSKTFIHVRDINMPFVTTSMTPSPMSSKELYIVPHRSRFIHLMNIQSGKIIQSFVSGHQMKVILTKCEGDYLISYGADGIVIVKTISTKKCSTIFSSHHRLANGVSSVVVDPYMKYVITLGKNGSLVCVVLKKIGKTEKKAEYEALFASPEYKELLLNPVLSEKAKVKVVEKLSSLNVEDAKTAVSTISSMKAGVDTQKVWVELKEEENKNREEQHSRRERQFIFDEIAAIRRKVKELLDENFSNPPERQLPVQVFDLDKVSRRKKIEDGKNEREKEKQMLLASMKSLNKITDIIKNSCWKSVVVKGKELRGITAPLVVQSYGLLPDKPPTKLKSWLMERMKIEGYFRKGDFFEPWVPRTESLFEMHINKKFQVPSLDIMQTVKTKFEEEQTDEEKIKAEALELSRKFVWTGTSSHDFIEVDPNHYSQFELTTFLQSHQEIYLIENDIKKLMLWFNKEFEEAFSQKEMEMAFVYEKNNRFRHIIDELSFFGFSPQICKTEIYDPLWAPEENPETIMTVEDNEIKVAKYISDSELEIIRLKEMEEERLRLLEADNFKEKALMAMMDGVLEKLWEDEIKKDVPQPKCMIEKNPENYTEDDIKAVKAYEEAVKFLQSERERYRKLLETEWNKTIQILKDSIGKFDEKVAKLHVLKLKVESAIGQEILKALRIRQRCFHRIEMARKEENIKLSLLKNEKKMDSLTMELNKLVEMLNECKNYHEMLQNKDRNLDKNFRREFPDYSPIVTEQLYKVSKKRPKLTQKTANYASVLNDMGKCALTNSKPEYLPVECVQYLKEIDALDAHSNAPAAVNQQSWELACKIRRQKIETELRIRACAIELADAETTVSTYQKMLKNAKDYHAQLQSDLQAVRDEKLNSSVNYQIQLVLKKGVIEVPLTGQISDFSEAVLVTQNTLLEVNKGIQKMGLQKLKAMQKAASFRKGIVCKEWEHRKLRMEIEDLKNQLETVEKLQVLKELQAILIARARGFSDEKGFLYLENEIAKVKDKFHKLGEEIISNINNYDKKIEKVVKNNHELDEKIMALNVEINELNLEYDEELDKKVVTASEKRMKKIWNRSKLVRKIQEQHNEILLLQTELELLRLKTYPTIKSRLE